MNSKPIDYVPSEMICEIFKHLNLDELINCKLVCKQWYSIVSQLVKLNKLVIIDDKFIRRKFYGIDEMVRDDDFIKIRWYFSNELVNINLEYCDLGSFLTEFNKNILSNLKQLKINGRLSKSFDLNQLNLFTKLIHLEIKSNNQDHLTLNLPNLEVLYIYLNSYCHYSIECPKLNVLFYGEYKVERGKLLHMKYPETIKHLEIFSVNSELVQFENVEYLKCSWYSLIKKDAVVLSNLKNLKEVYCDIRIDDFYMFIREDDPTIAELKIMLKDFLKSVKKLKMPDFKFHFFGLKITEDSIDLIKFKNRKHRDALETYFFAANYKYLQDSLPAVDYVDYNRLLNFVDPIPADYFSKFFAITKVSAIGLVDQAHFQWFLKNLQCLKRLELKNTNLNQSFYDDLPTFCSLIIFTLNDEHSDLNFDFIAKFARIILIEISSNLNLKSAKSLIKTIRNLEYLNGNILSFKYKNIIYMIWKKDSNRYNVSVSVYYLKKTNSSLHEVISYFEELEESSNSKEKSSNSKE